ncbi:MAG TPA: hypothetical protein VMF91_14555 [Bryobacteraceae bacterium]|nr:hypothetical protein [Bryobacteraceae bacterium]
MKAILFRTILVPIVVCTTVIATGCISWMDPMRGTYTDETGGIVLNLKSGGNAIFTFAGQPDACTYKVEGKQLLLTCKGESGALGFTIDKDGSLIPKSELITRMRKKT